MSNLQHLIDAADIHERLEKMARENSQLKAENNQLRIHLCMATNSLEFLNSRFENQRNEFLRPCSELINEIYEFIDRFDEKRENNTALEITTASNNQTRNNLEHELVEIENEEEETTRNDENIKPTAFPKLFSSRKQHGFVCGSKRHFVRFIDDRIPGGVSQKPHELLSYVRKSRKLGAKSYCCERCPFKTSSSLNIRIHLMHHRTHQPECLFKCNSCNYRATKPQYITNHAIIHQNSPCNENSNNEVTIEEFRDSKTGTHKNVETIRMSSILSKHK